MIKILFVCAGNTCRSVMCEYIFKNLVSEKKLLNKFDIKSCGVVASDGSPAANNAIEAIKNINLDIKNHKAQKISNELVSRSDYIFALDNYILRYLKQEFDLDKKNNIYKINNTGILDPFGKSLEAYKNCAQEIKKSLDKILDFIINNEKF